LVDWTCLLFAGTMTGTALRWLMDFNFAEPGDNPVMELPGANRRDLAALANVLNLLVNLGVRVPEAWVHAQFDIPKPVELKETEDRSQETGAVERILTPNQASSSNQMRTDTFGNPLTAAQAQRALDAIRLRAITEGRDLRAFDQLAVPIEALIAGKKSPADALHELKAAADALAPSQLDGLAPQLLILGDLIARPANFGDHHD
jgi:phage gp29-like protein